MRFKLVAPVLLGLLLLVAAGMGACSLNRTSTSHSTTESSSHTTTSRGSSSSSGTIRTTTTGGSSSSAFSSTSTTILPPTTARTTSTTLVPAKNYTRVPTTTKVVALTFDAAYDPTPLKDILSALKGAGAAATFFLTGEFIHDFPQWTKQIVSAGYPIGNHSYSHPDFTTLTSGAMRTQIERMAAALVKLGGSDPKPLFRAPYGALNKRVLSVLHEEGYVSVFWTIDTLDWKPERTPTQIEATVLGKLQPGAIILMHVGSKQTAQILPELIKKIQAQGYGFVDLRKGLSVTSK